VEKPEKPNGEESSIIPYLVIGSALVVAAGVIAFKHFKK
jgi:hypothetical protein